MLSREWADTILGRIAVHGDPPAVVFENALQQKGLGRVMLEKCLIEYCAPTLASLKTGSLFNFPVVESQDVQAEIRELNRELWQKGVILVELRQRGGKALIYVFRSAFLERDLRRPDVQRFLAAYGYGGMSMAQALVHLKRRLAECDPFPHEIGVFLGYPLNDVIGFIENGGQNAKCSGCWKVYGDECEAKRAFARFEKCRSVCTRLWNEGRSVGQLAVG